MNEKNGYERIEYLKSKEKEIRDIRVAETVKFAKRKKREQVKVTSIVGSALIREAQKDAALRAKLIEALNVSVVDERERVILKKHAWL